MLPFVLLAIHAGLIVYSSRLHSVTIDEAAHIPAGLVHWNTGTFGAYRVNPPLSRMLATLPLLFTDCQWVGEAPGASPDPFRRIEWDVHKSFYQFNRADYQRWVFLARAAGVLWSCLGGWLVFRWATDLYGHAGGILALAVWCFEPNILAYAQLATPDLPSTVAALLAMYAFWNYLQSPVWPGAILSGMALGLALLTKFTLMALLPACLILLLLSPKRGAETRARTVAVRATHTLLALAAMLLVVNLGYFFDGTGRRLGEISFISQTFTGIEQPVDARAARGTPGNRFHDSWMGRLPVPLPEDLLRGIDVQRRDFEEMRYTRPSYLAGEWRNGGWWYYYLYALAVKLPVGVIALAVGGLLLGLFQQRCAASWRDELAVYLPGLFIVALVSSQTGFNHHMRYVLPALPFFIVGMGKLAWFFQRGRWLVSAGVGAVLLWAVGSSLAVYPHSLSYFNEPSGGPENGHAHLVDSNIDWGQDVLFLKRWLEAHPDARPMHMAVFGHYVWDMTGQPELFAPPGPESSPAETCGPRPGWYAISVNALRGLGIRGASANSLTYFQHFRPVDRVGYSIYIYHLDRDECNRVRKQLGLPAVE